MPSLQLEDDHNKRNNYTDNQVAKKAGVGTGTITFIVGWSYCTFSSDPIVCLWFLRLFEWLGGGMVSCGRRGISGNWWWKANGNNVTIRWFGVLTTEYWRGYGIHNDARENIFYIALHGKWHKV